MTRGMLSPQNLMLLVVSSFLLFTSTPAAVADETVTTTDGRLILLREDSTYEFVHEATPDATPVDIVDLKISPEAWLGRLVQVLGTFPAPTDGTTGTLYQHSYIGGVAIDMDFRATPKSVVRKLLKSCKPTCEDAEVIGMFEGGHRKRIHIKVRDVLLKD